MSEIKVNKISPRAACGTVQLGDSGDTITIPAGATITNNGTQTGFGRTGTVNWDTTIKTTDFTATSGSGFFVNTGGGSNITVTLPASPSAGDIVSVADYGGTAATNNIIIARNGSNIEGGTSNAAIISNRDALTLIFADSTQGWIPVNDNVGSSIAPEFVAATGGNATITCGNFKTHIFTSPGTFCVSNAGNAAGTSTVDYFVVAGGGGVNTGGGGAGGFRVSNSVGCVGACLMSPLANPTGLPVSVQGYPVVVGAGGASNVQPTDSTPGSVSSFSSISSAGGGFGQSNDQPNSGGPGGSGGGGGRSSTTNPGGGTGNTPPVSPPQGNNGAGTGASANYNAGSGGGAGAAATPSNGATTSVAGAGSFIAEAFIGAPAAPSYGEPGPVSQTRYFAGGGGGGMGSGTNAGGVGGGGDGTAGSPAGNAGVANTGGGAGGGSSNSDGAGGGSGIVMIRYKFQ